MMLRRYVLAAVLLISFSSIVCAATEQEENFKDKIAPFRQVSDVVQPKIMVPTVVELPLEALPFSRTQVAVFDMKDNIFVPNIIVQKGTDALVPVQVYSDKSRGIDTALYDRDFETSVDFDLPEGRAGETILTFISKKPFTADGLWIGLSQHVAMPEKVEIRAEIDGVSRIVLAETNGKNVCPGCMNFPATSASKWQVRLRYGQPLRIAEIALRQVNKQAVNDTMLRFLAQPDHAYRIFRDPDRSVFITVGESGDLRSDKGILRLSETDIRMNTAYRESDIDKDDIPDSRDNCISIANVDQGDIDGNLRGDACDDYDRDHVVNSLDNCPNIPNVSQQDADSDKIGDACDNEESRITEKYTWLSWVVLALAASLLCFFFFRVTKNSPPKDMS